MSLSELRVTHYISHLRIRDMGNTWTQLGGVIMKLIIKLNQLMPSQFNDIIFLDYLWTDMLLK